MGIVLTPYKLKFRHNSRQKGILIKLLYNALMENYDKALENVFCMKLNNKCLANKARIAFMNSNAKEVTNGLTA